MPVVDIVVAAAAIKSAVRSRGGSLKPVLGVNVTFRFRLDRRSPRSSDRRRFTSTQIGTLILEASAERAGDVEGGYGLDDVEKVGEWDDLFVYGHLPVTGGLLVAGVGVEESEHEILDGIAWSVAERA